MPRQKTGTATKTVNGNPKTRHCRFSCLGPWGLARALDEARGKLGVKSRGKAMAALITAGLESLGIKIHPASKEEVVTKSYRRNPTGKRD